MVSRTYECPHKVQGYVSTKTADFTLSKSPLSFFGDPNKLANTSSPFLEPFNILAAAFLGP